MELDHLFWVAFQSSLILGLVHGVNPCGHSWLVLAPLVVGQKRGARVAWWTAAFLAGTAIACLLLGLTLGAVSAAIPPALEQWVDIGTALLLLALGMVLIWKPGLIHHHHDDPHHHGEEPHRHDPHHREHDHGPPPQRNRLRLTGEARFAIGFVNMIIPCPTAAIMVGYTLDSGNPWQASAIFGVYAAGTALAVATVIFAIYRVARLLERLSQDWVETALMRFAGAVTMAFAGYSLLERGVL